MKLLPPASSSQWGRQSVFAELLILFILFLAAAGVGLCHIAFVTLCGEADIPDGIALLIIVANIVLLGYAGLNGVVGVIVDEKKGLAVTGLLVFLVCGLYTLNQLAQF